MFSLNIMKNAIVLNAVIKNRRWRDEIRGLDPVKELIKKLKKIGIEEDIFIIVDDTGPRQLRDLLNVYNKIQIDDLRAKNVFQKIYSSLSLYENIIYLYIDTPLIDIEITEKMLALHIEELAEYTYGEGFPAGITPEIIKADLFPKLSSLLANDNSEIERGSIFYSLSKEINSFDIETYFSSEDLKLMRIELSTSVRKNALLVEQVIENEGILCGYDRFCAFIRKHPAVLRTVPSYIEIEITSSANEACIYSPLRYIKRAGGSLDYDYFRIVLDKIRAFSEDFYVAFSLLGEPLMHQQIKKFIEYTLQDKNINLILETDGILFDPAFSDYISDLEADNLHLIFEVDASESETYKKIRGGDLNRVERNIRYLLSKTGKNVYVQMVRIDENEQEMLKFYDLWEKEGAGVIIQNYNSYAGLLPDISKYDLRPLERIPCWHLQRDMVVFHNGDVPRCKQDINGLFPMGNLLSDEISEVWEKGKPCYLKHHAEDYDEYCVKCNEYYTFNF